MSGASRVAGRLARLPPASTRAVSVERDLPMSAEPGVVLLADRWYPAGADPSPRPVVLLRSPYGRRQFGVIARLIAERGYQVVVQSCRGTFGSGGTFEPFRHEQGDGKRALAWLAEQPWGSGPVVTFGPSYLGLTQWAVAVDPPPALVATALAMTASRFRDIVLYPGGSFTLETGAVWLYLLEHQESGWRRLLLAQIRARRRLGPASSTLPLSKAEQAVLGREVGYYQDWLVHDRLGDPWWDVVDFSRDVTRFPAATLLGGWYDIFLPAQVDDFTALRAEGRTAQLTIGPWTHSSLGGAAAGLRDALEWFDAQLGPGPDRRSRAPVRLWVMGREEWVDVASWPPPSVVQPWYLHAGARLDRRRPDPSQPDRYRYDPDDPTPGIGGPSLDATRSGPKNQRRREERPDVLSFTSDPLPAAMTVAGPLHAELWLRPSRAQIDVFVRLCVVSRRGRSTNLSDGILRVAPLDGSGADPGPVASTGGPEWGSAERTADGTIRVRLRMWPTAVTFARGECVRVQVSAGAHPLFARNLGAGEPLASATALVAVDHEVFHDPDHPSAVELPLSSI